MRGTQTRYCRTWKRANGSADAAGASSASGNADAAGGADAADASDGQSNLRDGTAAYRRLAKADKRRRSFDCFVARSPARRTHHPVITHRHRNRLADSLVYVRNLIRNRLLENHEIRSKEIEQFSREIGTTSASDPA